MGRLSNWEEILYCEIDKARHKSFKYGTHDCTIWVYNTVRKYASIPNFTPSWTSKFGAAKQYKLAPMEVQVSRVLRKSYRANILNTKRGDIVQFGLGTQASLGICIGAQVVCLLSKGICYVPLDKCNYSWEI